MTPRALLAMLVTVGAVFAVFAVVNYELFVPIGLTVAFAAYGFAAGVTLLRRHRTDLRRRTA